MKHKIKFPVKKAAVFCSLAACLLFTGCGQQATQTSVQPEEKTLIQENQDAAVVTAGSIRCDANLEELSVSNASAADLALLLPQLPQLKKLTLEGNIPEYSRLLELKAQHPEVTFLFQAELGGKTVTTDQITLDLTDSPVTFEELNPVLPLFADLRELLLTGSGLSDADVMNLADNYPDLLVISELPLAGQRFSTSSTEIDISGCPVTLEEVEHMLPYFPSLQKLDMSFCGYSDEEMHALNQRHPEVNIVWTLKIGEVKTRTDAIYFYPAESNYYPTNSEMEKLRYCPDLIAVDIGHTRATDCEFLWYTPKVKYLILADTGITDITPVGNLKDLIYLELFNLRIDDYSPLLNCTKLQDLNIGTTYADPEPLSKMTWLHNLQWHRSDQNPETKEAVLKLPEQLPDTNVVLFPMKKARNIGGPWRYIPNYYVFRDIIGATYFNQDQIADYWGEEDAARIMACESGKSFCAYTLAQIIRERIDNHEPIIGLKNTDSEKAEILYESLMNAQP